MIPLQYTNIYYRKLMLKRFSYLGTNTRLFEWLNDERLKLFSIQIQWRESVPILRKFTSFNVKWRKICSDSHHCTLKKKIFWFERKKRLNFHTSNLLELLWFRVNPLEKRKNIENHQRNSVNSLRKKVGLQNSKEFMKFCLTDWNISYPGA